MSIISNFNIKQLQYFPSKRYLHDVSQLITGGISYENS